MKAQLETMYFKASAFTCKLIKGSFMEFNVTESTLRQMYIWVYLPFSHKAKLYNKHNFIIEYSSCYGNENRGSPRDSIIAFLP